MGSRHTIRPGQVREVPIPELNPAIYELVAQEPKGLGMIVAILSTKPVQIVDLPDLPKALAASRNASKVIDSNTRTTHHPNRAFAQYDRFQMVNRNTLFMKSVKLERF